MLPAIHPIARRLVAPRGTLTVDGTTANESAASDAGMTDDGGGGADSGAADRRDGASATSRTSVASAAAHTQRVGRPYSRMSDSAANAARPRTAATTAAKIMSVAIMAFLP